MKRNDLSFEEWNQRAEEEAAMQALDVVSNTKFHINVTRPAENPAPLGKKWCEKMDRVWDGLADAYGTDLVQLLLIAYRFPVFVPEFKVHLLKAFEACARDGYLENPVEVRPELLTVDGYVRSEGFAYTIFSYLVNSGWPIQLFDGTKLKKYPEAYEILEGVAIVWYLDICNKVSHDVVDIGNALFEISDALELAHGGRSWGGGIDQEAEKRRIAGKAGADKRHSPMLELKAWTIERYKQGVWKSANAAAYDLVSEVMDHGRKIKAHLSPANAQRTIAEWIRKSV